MSGESPNDQAKLISLLRASDPVAFRTLIDTYKRPIYLLCLRLMSDESEAEDMTQETFIRAYQAIGQFRGEASLNTWLYRIASNLCKNRIGYLSRRKQNSHDHLPALEARAGDLWQREVSTQVKHDQPEEAIESKEAQAMIIKALNALPEKQKVALTLRDVQGLTYQEIVEVTGASLGTVKSRIHQGRLSLVKTYRELLSGDEITKSGGTDD